VIVYQLFNAIKSSVCRGFEVTAHYSIHFPQQKGPTFCRKMRAQRGLWDWGKAGGEGVSLIIIIIYIYMYLSPQNLLLKGPLNGSQHGNRRML